MQKNLNVLITGASGLLGRQVYQYLTEKNLQNKYPVVDVDTVNWNCLGLCHSRVKNNLKQIDLNNAEQIDKLLEEFKPNVIIHCAAERRVEVVESNFDNVLKLNKGATDYLAQACAKQGILFIYISTDYVFDGKNPPYKVDAQPNPLNKYGFSKLSGETVTMDASKEHCIVRVPVLYGFTEANNYAESAVNILVEKVKKGQPYSVDHAQVRFPTHCIDVARFLARLIIKRFQSNSESTQVKGIFHCSGLEPFSKYNMSCVIADLYNLSKDYIKPDFNADSSLRPQNAQLDTNYSYELLDFRPVMEFRNSIKDCLEIFA